MRRTPNASRNLENLERAPASGVRRSPPLCFGLDEPKRIQSETKFCGDLGAEGESKGSGAKGARVCRPEARSDTSALRFSAGDGGRVEIVGRAEGLSDQKG